MIIFHRNNCINYLDKKNWNQIRFRVSIGFKSDWFPYIRFDISLLKFRFWLIQINSNFLNFWNSALNFLNEFESNWYMQFDSNRIEPVSVSILCYSNTFSEIRIRQKNEWLQYFWKLYIIYILCRLIAVTEYFWK